MIHFKCQCGFERDVSDESSGKSIRCPKCKTISRVPAPEFAEISHDPADYADDQPFTPDPISATKAVDRPGDSERTAVNRPERGNHNSQGTEENDTLLAVVFFLKILAMLGALATSVVFAAILSQMKNALPLAISALVSGLIGSAWTYVGAEAVRLLVEIERNTRKH